MKTCVSNTLKESPGRRQEHQARDNWKRLEHQASGDRLLQKILQVKRKFIFTFIWAEKKHQEVRRSCKHDFFNQELDRKCARVGKYTTNIQDFLPNVAICSQFTSDCLWASSWLTKEHEDLKRFDTVNTATSENIDRSQRRIQHTNLAGLEHISMVKNYVAE